MSTPARASLPRLPLLAGLPTLEGTRVRLRQIDDADVPALFTIFGDPDVTRYWSWAAFTEEAAARRLLEDTRQGLEQGTLLQWGITTRQDDALVGTCTLARPNAEHRRAEIGFALARTAWGKGYASDAVRLAIDYAFDVLDLNRLEADVDPRNMGSLRTLEKLGFMREGYQRERYHVNGEVQDSVLLGLLRHEWSQSSRMEG